MKKYVKSLSCAVLFTLITLFMSFVLIYNGIMQIGSDHIWLYIGVEHIICGIIFIFAIALNSCNIFFFAKPIENYQSKHKFVIATVILNCFCGIFLLIINLLQYSRTYHDINTMPIFDYWQLGFSIVMILLNVLYITDVIQSKNK